jgi:hypothetical protein
MLGEPLVGFDGHDRTDHHGRRSLDHGAIDGGVEHDHGAIGGAAR